MERQMNIAYVRVSDILQNEGRQVEELEKHNIDKWYKEKVSGKDTKRPKLQEMLGYIDNFYEFNKGLDLEQQMKLTVYIHSFDRLARNTKDLLELVELLESKGIGLRSLKEDISTDTPTGKLMLTLLGAISEFERANLLERQREGIAIAKREGKYKGRKKIKVNDKFKDQYERYMNREINKVEFAKILEISRPTLDRLIVEYKEKLENGNRSSSIN